MKEIRLRHHHLLCTRTFVGKGYDHRFVANMEAVVDAMRSPGDLIINLSMSVDDICSSCPNEVCGLCAFESSVLEKDRSVALFLGLPDSAAVPAEPLIGSVLERLKGVDDLGSVCGRCDWVELCNERLAQIKGE